MAWIRGNWGMRRQISGADTPVLSRRWCGNADARMPRARSHSLSHDRRVRAERERYRIATILG